MGAYCTVLTINALTGDMLSTSMNGKYMAVSVTALLTCSFTSETSLKPRRAGLIVKRAEC